MIGSIISRFLPWWPLVLAALAFSGGWYVQGKRCVAEAQAVQVAALSATITAYQNAQQAAAERSDELEDKLAAITKENRSLTGRLSHETRSDSYRCALPGPGLQLLNAARTGDPADAAGEPDGGVRGAGAGPGR